MEILYLLVPVSVVLVLLIGALFYWSLGSGQFDDLDSPAMRILDDGDEAPSAPQPGASAAAGPRAHR